MTDLYIPEGISKKQTRQIIKVWERYGVGSCFMPSRANITITDCESLVKAGYMERLCGVTTYYYRLTEAAQVVIDANN